MEEFKVPTLPGSTAKSESAEQVVKDITETENTAKIPDEAKPEAVEQKKEDETKSRPKTKENCPYKVPPWSAAPSADLEYKFEVLKGGQIIEELKQLQKKAVWKFGRLPENDIEMAHPTISRFHAVLQYRPKARKQDLEDEKSNNETETENDKSQPAEGWYIYDLGSTHGTFLNKQRIPARVFIRIQVGHMLKLGASSRSYILQGPPEDEEPESELTVTELRLQRQQREAEAAAEAQRKAKEAVEREENEGVSWGMSEDADEETDLTHNPYASSNNEELFLDDPKRTLRGYFEREDVPLEYKCDEMSVGSFVCRVELPIDDANGRPIIAEVVHKGRKKDCVVQCALEACRILDRHGVLRQANQEPLKRKVKSQASDSDEDEFWDRTGDVERKKMRKANVSNNITLTYDDLLKQEDELAKQMQEVELSIAKYQDTQKRLKAAQVQTENSDDLDSFMENLNEDATKLDKTEIKKLRFEQQRIKMEQQKLQRLIKIAKPVELSFAKSTTENENCNLEAQNKVSAVKRQLPMIGKRNQFTKFKVVKLAKTMQATENKTLASDEEEVEDEDTESVKDKEKNKQQMPVEIKKQNIDKSLVEQKSEVDIPNEETIEARAEQVKTYGPAIIPQEILSNKEKDINDDGHIENSLEDATNTLTKASNEVDAESITEIASNSVVEANDEHNDSNTKKRQRQRQRLRHKRQDVDIDELIEHESSEKYAKWVPPENQSGDGYTKLNEKYGY